LGVFGNYAEKRQSAMLSRALFPLARYAALFGFVLLLALTDTHAHAQSQPRQLCPAQSIQPRPAEFAPGGIILTTFDRSAIWVYNIDGNNRYPLPDTVPCVRNCRTSPDHRWLTRIDPLNGFAFYKMRFDGTQRTLLVSGAADVEWWTPETLLVWTPDHRAYLVPEANAESAERDYLDARGAVAIQPGGRYALTVRQNAGGEFVRELEDLEVRGLVGVAGSAAVSLGEDVPYYNNAAWSPDGSWLAFVKQTVFDENAGVMGSELFGVRPGDNTPQQWTDLFSAYGAVRVNGRIISDLIWASDSTRVAFWVIELIGGNPEANTGSAVIHVYDVTSGELTAYCGYSTVEHTPNPPRLVWSPDNTHIAFGGNVPNDDKGYLLLALNTADGTFTELSSGIYPALGSPDVIGWGMLP